MKQDIVGFCFTLCKLGGGEGGRGVNPPDSVTFSINTYKKWEWQPRVRSFRTPLQPM